MGYWTGLYPSNLFKSGCPITRPGRQLWNGYRYGLILFFFLVLRPVAPVPTSRGRRRSKGVPVGTQTKHDADVCGRRNVRNMEKVRPHVYYNNAHIHV